MIINELEVRATLRLARCLINTPEKWCKGMYQDKYGRFCVAGACREASNQLGFNSTWQAVGRLQEQININVMLYNDTHTHEEVLELFNKTIKEMENLA